MSSKTAVQLVQLDGFSVPFKLPDLEALHSLGCRLTKFPNASMGVLRNTVLRGAELSVIDWAEAKERLMQNFCEGLQATFPEHRVKMDGTSDFGVLLKQERDVVDTILTEERLPRKSNTPPPSVLAEQAFQDSLKKMTARLTQYAGCYCHRVRTAYRDKEGTGARVYRFILSPDYAMSNVGYYLPEVASKDQECTLQLGSAYRLRFCVSSLEGKPTLAVVAQDHIGDQWVDGLRRTFHLSQIEDKSVLSVAQFFLATLYKGEPRNGNDEED